MKKDKKIILFIVILSIVIMIGFIFYIGTQSTKQPTQSTKQPTQSTKQPTQSTKQPTQYEPTQYEQAQDAQIIARAKANAKTRAIAEAEEKAKAIADAKAETDAKAEADAEIKAEIKAEAIAKAEIKAEIAEAKAETIAAATAEAKAEAIAKANIYIPFVVAEEKTDTKEASGGGGNAIFLDRFEINCDNNGINRLQYMRVGNDNGKYEYNCADGGVLENNVLHSTKQVDLDRGNINDLNNIDINCGKNNVLTSLYLQRGLGGKHQYNYNCAANKQSKKLKCRNVATPLDDDGDGNLFYLDRHNIVCKENEALSQLMLVHYPDKNQYQYTCCS